MKNFQVNPIGKISEKEAKLACTKIFEGSHIEAFDRVITEMESSFDDVELVKLPKHELKKHGVKS